MEEEWREGAEWLARIGLISPDHVITSPSAKMSDLAKFLRDGVMLCKMLNILDEHSIDLGIINQRPQNAQVSLFGNILVYVHKIKYVRNQNNFGF